MQKQHMINKKVWDEVQQISNQANFTRHTKLVPYICKFKDNVNKKIIISNFILCQSQLYLDYITRKPQKTEPFRYQKCTVVLMKEKMKLEL